MNPQIRTIVIIAGLALVEAIQVLIIVVTIFHFIPIAVRDSAKDIFPVLHDGLKPEREIFFFHVFVFTCLSIDGLILWFLRKRLGQTTVDTVLVQLMAVDAGWLLVQLFAVFKILLYGNLIWPKFLFYGMLTLSILSRIFWIELSVFLANLPHCLGVWGRLRSLRLGADAAVIAFLCSCLWVVDLQRVWAVINLWGSKALVDQSWASINPWFKGIAYQQALPWLIAANIIYCICFYIFLRMFTRSILLAVSGLMLFVKLQFFHLGIAPIIWQFPAKTPVLLVSNVMMALNSQTTVSFVDCLRGRNFFAFTMQFLIPVIYCATYIMAASYKSDWKVKLVKLVSIGGLVLFLVHVLQATISNYYSVSTPLVIVLCFWADRLMEQLTPNRKFIVTLMLAVVCTGALYTNNLFGVYPNIWNVSSVNWSQIEAVSLKRGQ